MIKIRQNIYFDNATDDELDELYEKFNEVDFFYGENHLRFTGTPERLQELVRYCDAIGIRIKN